MTVDAGGNSNPPLDDGDDDNLNDDNLDGDGNDERDPLDGIESLDDAKARIAELDTELVRERERKATTVGSRDKLRSRVHELERENREFKDERRERTRKRARDKNDYKALEKSMREEAKELREKLVERDQQIAERDRRDRRNALLDGMVAKTELSKVVLSGLLREAEARGLELPEEVDDDVVDATQRRLEALEPAVFKGKPTGSPGTPGVNISNKPTNAIPSSDEEARVLALAQNWNKPKST